MRRNDCPRWAGICILSDRERQRLIEGLLPKQPASMSDQGSNKHSKRRSSSHAVPADKQQAQMDRNNADGAPLRHGLSWSADEDDRLHADVPGVAVESSLRSCPKAPSPLAQQRNSFSSRRRSAPRKRHWTKSSPVAASGSSPSSTAGPAPVRKRRSPQPPRRGLSVRPRTRRNDTPSHEDGPAQFAQP
jgi:hypothetical protein